MGKNMWCFSQSTNDNSGFSYFEDMANFVAFLLVYHFIKHKALISKE